MAPVSMSELAGISTTQPLANSIAGFLGAARIVSLNDSETARRRSMELTLSFLALEGCAAFLQPIAYGGIQDPGYGNFPELCRTLQVGFQVPGETPTVDFGFHALHCSAWPLGKTSSLCECQIRDVLFDCA